MPAADTGQGAMLDVNNLRKSFGPVKILDGVTFSAEPGSVVALAGGNGTGKSTLLKCLAGILRFDGSVSIAGHSLDGRPAVRSLVGYLPQSVALPETSTVVEVISFFARLRQADADELPLPREFLPDVDARVGTLSGGQRQRVAIAVALLGSPPLLLLDEPVANLDEDGRDALWATISSLTQAGACALVASPSPTDLGAAPDRAIVLEGGSVAYDGSAEGLNNR